MTMNKEQINRLIYLAKNQWKPIALGVLILVSLIVTLLIPSGGKDAKEEDPGAAVRMASENSADSPTPTKKPLNPFGFLFDKDKEDKEAGGAVRPTPPAFPGNVINENTSRSTVTKVNSDGTSSTQTISGTGSIKTSQGIINPNTNIEKDISGNEDQDNIAIVFQNPDGTTTKYIPPGTPPDEVRWARYINRKENYEINYPFNWQFVYSVDGNGHEGIALYPPGVNKNDPRSQYVGFGVTRSFLLPAVGDTSNALVTPIRVDGVSGDLYTNGPLGNSYIASIFSYNGNYFGLGASKSDTTFAYVYYFMLHSLTFTN
jgi:hypothetical protein